MHARCTSAVLELAFNFRYSLFLLFHTIPLCIELYKVPENICRKIFIPKFSQSKSQVKAFVSNKKSIWHENYLLLNSQVLCNLSCIFQTSVLLNKENKIYVISRTHQMDYR